MAASGSPALDGRAILDPVSSPPSSAPAARPPRRWQRRLVGVALLGLALAAGLWSYLPARHALLLALTSLERRWSAAEGPAPGVGPAQSEHWIHAAWVDSASAHDAPRGALRAVAEFRGVEVDLMFSRDFVPFACHSDREFALLTGRPGASLAALESHEIDRLLGPEGLPALRLSRLVEAAAGEVLVLDLKTDHQHRAERARGLVQALGKRRAGVWVVGRSAPLLGEVRALAPDLVLGCEGYLAWGNYLAGFQVLSLDRVDLTPARDARARSLGLKRLYWTARDPAELSALRAWRPDALLLDLPRLSESLPARARLGGS